MRLRNLFEGPNDPHIFKAVFLAGAAGSGKSTIARKLFGGTGLRFVDMDNFSRMYRKTGKTGVTRREIRYHTRKHRESLMDGRIGMVIDGTGRHPPDIIDVREQLEDLGYDTMMLFVNVNLENSLSRTAQRATTPGPDFGRTIPADHVEDMWYEVKYGARELKMEFGNNFVMVDNNSDGLPDLTAVQKQFNRWLAAPPASPAAQDWMSSFQNQRS